MIDIDPIDRMLGNNLRFLRLMKGFTQTEVGNMLNVSFQQIQKYEHGNNRISARTLCKLRDALDVRYVDFFNPLAEADLTPSGSEQDKIIISVIRHLLAIPSLKKKKAILGIIKELAEEYDDTEQEA